MARSEHIGQSIRPKFEMGVLFVHGIGQQRQGDTLLQFGEPLVQWLKSWLGNAEKEHNPDAVKIIDAQLVAPPDDPSTPPHAALLLESSLRGVSGSRGHYKGKWLLAESRWAESFPSPQYAELAFWSLQVLPYTLLAHFDRRIQMAAQQLHAVFFRRSLQNAGHRVPHLGLVAVFQYLLESAYLVGALFLAPILITILLLLLFVGLIPIPQLRSGIAKVQRGLAATVGDSYVLLGREIAETAILSKVKRDLDWLSGQCLKVAVVAHSQGAAIAHRVLKTSPPEQCRLLITFGSGLRKLSQIRSLISAPSGMFPLWTTSAVITVLTALLWTFIDRLGTKSGLLVAFGLLLTFLVNRGLRFFGLGMYRASKGVTDLGYGIVANWVAERVRVRRTSFWKNVATAGTFISVLGGLLLLLIAGWWLPVWIDPAADLSLRFVGVAMSIGLFLGELALTKWREATGRLFRFHPDWFMLDSWYRENRDTSLDLPEPIEWLDLYASSDPVSNGSLFHPSLLPPRMTQSQVYNRGSAITDHVTYWMNRDEFVAQVCCKVAKVAGLQLDKLLQGDQERLIRHRRRRHSRVRQLKWTRWILGMSGTGLAIMRWEDLSRFGLTVLKLIHSSLSVFSAGLLERLSQDLVLSRSVGIAVLAAIFFVIYYLIFRIWSAWGSSEAKALLERTETPAQLAVPRLFWFLNFATVGYTMWVASSFPAAWWVHGLIAVVSVLFTLGWLSRMDVITGHSEG